MSRQRLHPRDAAELVRVAKAVRRDCQATAAALATGAVNAEQAEVITAVMAHLPPVDPQVPVDAEEFLITYSADLNPVELRKAGRHLIETLTVDPDPDGRAARQRERRYLDLVPAYDGSPRHPGTSRPRAGANPP